MADAPAVRTYASEAIEVGFDARRCIHAAACLRGLPEVFDTSRRPWILPQAADADAIARVVERCPSGALRYRRLDGGPPEAAEAVVRIRAMRDGPLEVRGQVVLTGADRTPLPAGPPRMTLCRCGGTGNPPYCDNSHRANGFRG